MAFEKLYELWDLIGIKEVMIGQEFLMIVLILIALMFLLFCIIIWIATLIHQAKRKKWVWFTLTLVLSLLFGIGLLMVLIYWIVQGLTPKSKKKK